MLFCIRAALVGTFLLFLPGLLEQFEAPKAAVIRVLGIGALAAWLASSELRRRFRPSVLDGAVLAWLGVELLTTLTSVSPRISLLGDTKQSEGLLTSLALAGLYLAARDGGRDPRLVRGTTQVALAAAALTGVYAALQALRLDPTRWTHIATYEVAGPFVRPFGTLGHPNVLGVITASGMVCAIAMAVGERRRSWIYGGLAAFFALVTVATLSRGAWLGALLGTGVALGLAARSRREVGAGRAVLWVAAAAGAVVIGLALFGFGATIGQRLGEFFHPESGSARSRLEIWRIALRAWQARPWLGQGPDTFELTFPRFQTPEYWRFEWATVPAHAHSIYLHTMASRGLLGLVAGLALGIGWLMAAWAAWRNAPAARATAIALVSVVATMAVAGGFGALGNAGAAWLAVAAGSLLALGTQRTLATVERKPGGKSRREAPRAADRSGFAKHWVAGFVAAALMAALSIALLLASRSSFEALDWAPRREGDGDPARAVRAADRAVRLTPWDDVSRYYRAQAWLRVATAGGPVAALDSAEASARAAIAIEPSRMLDHQCLGAVLLARARAGDPLALERARAAFADASALAPYNALLWLQLADAEIALGHAADALPRIRRALELYPDPPIVKRMLERASTAAAARPPG